MSAYVNEIEENTWIDLYYELVFLSSASHRISVVQSPGLDAYYFIFLRPKISSSNGL
jgi:hypothetical protein